MILTGPRGVGKSTACLAACWQAQARGYRSAGIVTCRGAGDSLDVMDVSTGDERRLTLAESAERSIAVVQGRFLFDPAVLAWGNNALLHALPCDLLVVDEIGPLEADRRLGWMAAFDVLQQEGFVLAVVVVRPELVSWAQSALDAQSESILPVTSANRDGVPFTIVEMLG